ncbi:hypothetical protein GSB9_02039 [Flavobacteriaceae bacterium GSB9]|nr:hypothetical protein GSB9_02039 [Flavobacteriaceae bacterium GSB9]
MIDLKKEKLQRMIVDAFNGNKVNFIDEINNKIYDNEYPVNQRTEVVVKGYFNWDDCCPYVQFQIKMDDYQLDTEFYKNDFNVMSNDVRIDETEVDGEVVIGLILYQDDLV